MVAFSPEEYPSKAEFLRRKKIGWGTNRTTHQIKGFAQDLVEDLVDQDGIQAFETITGNNRRKTRSLLDPKRMTLQSKPRQRYVLKIQILKSLSGCLSRSKDGRPILTTKQPSKMFETLRMIVARYVSC